jgi:hypothetical protein
MFCSLGEKTKIMDVNMRFPGVKGDFPRYYDHLITDHTRRNQKIFFGLSATLRSHQSTKKFDMCPGRLQHVEEIMIPYDFSRSKVVYRSPLITDK